MQKHAIITCLYIEEDQGFIATDPAFPYCSAFGLSEEEARAEFEVVLRGVIQATEDLRRIPPSPQVAVG